MAKIYVGRDGERMTPKLWREKRADVGYTVVRQYDNGAVQAQLRWSGIVADSDTFEEYWPVFILIVKNYRNDGTLVNDPVDDGKLFPNEGEAIAGYEEFLMRWTDCSITEEGNFLDTDNTLAPVVPPEPELPPDPNRPQSVSDELDDLGAW